MSEKVIEKQEIITQEKGSVKLTLVFSVERENVNDLTMRKLWYEQDYVFEISDSRKCRRLMKNSYPFTRSLKQQDGSFKDKTFWGYKIFHESKTGLTQQVDFGISEDSAHGLGIRVTSSKPKRIKTTERLKELLQHCEGDFNVFEGKISEGKTRRF